MFEVAVYPRCPKIYDCQPIAWKPPNWKGGRPLRQCIPLWLGVLPPPTRHDESGAHPKRRIGADQQKGDAHCGQQVVVTKYLPRKDLTHQDGQARHLSHDQHGLYCIHLCWRWRNGVRGFWMPSCCTFNYFIKLVGADFVSWTQHSHSDGSRVCLTLFDYYNSTHLNMLKFATNFKNINILESGRPASKLDITHLKKLATVIKPMTEYFQGLFAMGVPDTSFVSIIPIPPVPIAMAIQWHAPKSTSPVRQEPH